MATKIEESSIAYAKRLYSTKRGMTIAEISNLTNISVPKLTIIFRKAFKDGELTPRAECRALKPRVPNGQGKSGYIATGIGKGGRNKERKKFTEEQERQIAVDYYENGLTNRQLKEKYNIFPVQMQRIREKYGKDYPKKADPTIRKVARLDKNGNVLVIYNTITIASKEIGISQSAIVACCQGRLKTAKGYKWQYV